MNLSTVAVILEDHKLVKVYGGSKMVHMINSKIPNVEQHITLDMTGRDINELYKSLEYTIQMELISIELFDDVEANILINQIELLNSTTNSQGQMSQTVRDLVVIFGATLLFLSAVVICIAYYINSQQTNTAMDSQVFGIFGRFLSKLWSTI